MGIDQNAPIKLLNRNGKESKNLDLIGHRDTPLSRWLIVNGRVEIGPSPQRATIAVPLWTAILATSVMHQYRVGQLDYENWEFGIDNY